jgi:dienelactone hydrolase
MPDEGDVPITFTATDGWRLSGTLRRLVGDGPPLRGVVMVHGSHHARDTFVYGRALPTALAGAGIASIRFDIRGRGESRSPRPWSELSVAERRDVALDVAAALDHLRGIGIGPGRMGVIGEQDTATAVVEAAAADADVGALVLLSPRLAARALAALRRSPMPTYALASKEDRHALRDATAAFASAPEPHSALHVFHGLGFGATMFMARAFEQPDEPALEDLIAEWFDRVL